MIAAAASSAAAFAQVVSVALVAQQEDHSRSTTVIFTHRCPIAVASLTLLGSVHSNVSGSRVYALRRSCIIVVSRAATRKYICDKAIPRMLPHPFTPPFPTRCHGPALSLTSFHELPTRPITCSTTARTDSRCTKSLPTVG